VKHVHGEIDLIEGAKKLLHLLDRFTESTEEMVERELKKRKIQPPLETKAAPEPKIPVKLTPAEYGLIRLLRKANADVSRETSPRKKYNEVPKDEIPTTLRKVRGMGGL
jgi:hypothetical protein